jgi:hypothetical protein
MATDFKLGKVPGCILVSRALDMSERSLIGGDIAVNLERYFNFAYHQPQSYWSSGIETHTSGTRASGAIPRAPQSLYMAERSASSMLN